MVRLLPVQVAATRQHEVQQGQAGPSPSHAPSVERHLPPSDQPHTARIKEEHMRHQREDAELQQRVSAEKRGMPTTVDGFK